MASNSKMRVIMGPVGCWPAGTEYLTPEGWEPIERYTGGPVAGWNPLTGQLQFEQPLGYVDKPATQWVRFHRPGFDITMSEDHRMPVDRYCQHGKGGITWERRSMTALELAELKSQVKFLSTFTLPESGAGVSAQRKAFLQYAVAMNADGYAEGDSKAARFGFTKARKVERLKVILKELGLAYNHHTYPYRKGTTYHSIRVIDPPYRGKTFDSPLFWRLTAEELRIVIDELQFWDGHMRGATGYAKNLLVLDTTRESDVGFLQYAGAVCGYRTTVEAVPATKDRHKVLYRVKFISPTSVKHPVSLRAGGVNVAITDATKGERKYCFTMPSGHFIVRVNGHVLVSQNSGKSVLCCFEVIRRAGQQEPNKQGIRKSRCIVVRQTARQLQDTTIKTFLDWFPPGPCGEFRRTTKTYFFKVADVECEIMFRALDDADDVANLNSLEATFAWVNESRDIDPTILDALSKRVGRFPSKKDGGPTWHGIFMDTNPPVMDTYHYYMMEHLKPEDGVTPYDNGWDVYKQPSGRSPYAENIENLPDGYYDTQGKSEEYIRVFIDGEYGLSNAGRPVFKFFRPDIHIAQTELRPYLGSARPIVVGLDCGLTPAAVFGQMDPLGRALVYDEAVSFDMGMQRFIRQVLKPKIFEKFSGAPILIVVDPAGMQRAQTDERSVVDIIKAEGLKVIPARTNSVVARINAVDEYLMRQIDGVPGILLDPRCMKLKAALMGGYRYQTKGEAVEKNDHSHIADALQYLCLHLHSAMHGGLVSQARTVKAVSSVGWT